MNRTKSTQEIQFYNLSQNRGIPSIQNSVFVIIIKWIYRYWRFFSFYNIKAKYLGNTTSLAHKFMSSRKYYNLLYNMHKNRTKICPTNHLSIWLLKSRLQVYFLRHLLYAHLVSIAKYNIKCMNSFFLLAWVTALTKK